MDSDTHTTIGDVNHQEDQTYASIGMVEDYFDVVDDNGNAIDPCAEGSFVMAEGLQATGSATFEPYVPDFDATARQAAVQAFFAAHARVTTDNSGAAAVAVADENKRPVPFADDDASEQESVGDDYDDDGMGNAPSPSMGARIVTDPDDWALETILRRKVNKEKEGGLWQYLCKWVGHDEPTWETREVMEDAGWIARLDAFDAKGMNDNYKSRVSKKVSAERKNDPYAAHAFSLPSPSMDLLEGFFAPNRKAFVDVVVKAMNFFAHRYARMNPIMADRFLKRWEERKATHVPVICFHGTRAVNLRPIFKIGLVVGGTNGVRVANGTALGTGVYTARSGNTPQGYSRGSNAIMLCVGLVPSAEGQQDVYVSGEYLVFRNAEDVCPIWLVQVGGSATLLAPTEIRFDHLEAMTHGGFVTDLPFSTSEYGRLQMRYSAAMQSQGPIPKNNIPSDTKEPLTDHERKEAVKVYNRLSGSSFKGGVRKSALKGEPRRVKDLLLKASLANRK